MKITTTKISQKLRTARVNKQISIERLSEISGLSVGAISMFERQAKTNIGLDNLLAWINALELEASEIFGSTDLDDVNRKLDIIIKQTK
ncbi:helix-turn-helix domain-containing protein [Leuconostoc mesenteroides]|uniref:helix-turn-helix domain-containing protein n=1 Tax=Leuconostoc mesenteroides TaxID=1245 RepID=UPI0023608BEE|nr:helix-turn-helix transcriptional regulator [Leuconostoc mesenteroides]